MWKPAVPVVMVVALLCAVPASFTPELVGFADDAPAAKAQTSGQQTKFRLLRHLAGNTRADGTRSPHGAGKFEDR